MAALSAIVVAVWIVLFSVEGTQREPVAAPDTLLSEEYAFGTFRSASRVELSAQGAVVVTDVGTNTVFLYRSPREQPLSVGGYGWGTTSFDIPSAVATDGLTFYVSDYNNHRIQRFDRNLNYLSTFSTRDTGFVDARFGFPAGVALSRFGDIFILDSENIRVLKLSRSLRLERTFGGIETEHGRLRKPSKLAVTAADKVYVLDEDRIVEFDYFGNFVRSIGEGILKNAQGFDADRNGILAVAGEALYWFSLKGELRNIVQVSGIISSVPLSPLQDAALSDDIVYLLTPRHIIVLKILPTQ